MSANYFANVNNNGNANYNNADNDNDVLPDSLKVNREGEIIESKSRTQFTTVNIATNGECILMSYEKILCDANILHKAYLASVKTSSWKESTQKVILNYLTYIFKIKDDLQNRTLTNDPTDEFQKHERGKIRPITS